MLEASSMTWAHKKTGKTLVSASSHTGQQMAIEV
jgi:hypothetical protein